MTKTISAILRASERYYAIEYRQLNPNGWGSWRPLSETEEAKGMKTTNLKEDQTQAIMQHWIEQVSDEFFLVEFYYEMRIVPLD